MKNLQLEPNIRNILAEPKRHRLEVRVHHGHDVLLLHLVIIMFTRPKPAYGRQGLAGSWGQDTDKVSNFWVFLTSHFAQLGIKPTWDHS